MTCSSVGIEVWPFLVLTSMGVVAFLLVPARFQAWLRAHRTTRWFARAQPDSFFGDRGVWAIRAAGLLWALMWIASADGVYCFFHGPG